MSDKHILHSNWRDSLSEGDMKDLDAPQDVEQRKMLGDMLKAPADHFREATKKMERGRAIAEEALRTINGERQGVYGDPEDTFHLIAGFWSHYLGKEVTGAMVADMMCLLKLARQRGGKGTKDCYTDLLGYAMLGASMRGYDA